MSFGLSRHRITLGRNRPGYGALSPGPAPPGHQSFTYIKDLPVDYLKIDCRSYSSDNVGSIDRLTADYLIGIAHALDKSVIADSIVNAKALAAARKQGVDFVQGSYIGKTRATIPVRSYEKLISKFSKVA